MAQDVEDAIAATLRDAVGREVGTLMTPERAEAAALTVGGLVADQLRVPADAIRATPLGDPVKGEFGVRVEPHAAGAAGRLRAAEAKIVGGAAVSITYDFSPST